MTVVNRKKKGLQSVTTNHDNTRALNESKAAARLEASLRRTREVDFYGLVTIEVWVEAGQVKRVREAVARTTQIE